MNNTTKPLHVTISGYTGSGKTTLAQAIEKLCQEHGIEVIINRETDGDYHKQKNLANLAGKVTVVVTTNQLNRLSLGRTKYD